MRSATLACILLTLALAAFGQHSKSTSSGGGKPATNSKAKPKAKPTPVIKPKPPDFQKFQNEWRLLGKSGDFLAYYQWASVHAVESGAWKVWLKMVPIDLNAQRKKLTDIEK